MSYRDPYTELINLLMNNVQRVGAGIQNRGQEITKQNLRDQLRTQQVNDALQRRNWALSDAATMAAQRAQEITQAHNWREGDIAAAQKVQHQAVLDARQQALDDAATRRQQQLTDAATNLRDKQMQQLQEGLMYLKPDNPLFNQTQAAITALGGQNNLTGQAALDHAMQGIYNIPSDHPSPSGQTVTAPVNVGDLIGSLNNVKHEVTLGEGIANSLFLNAQAYVSDVSKPQDDRLSYINNTILPSTVLNNDQKAALLTSAGMSDPNAVQAAINKGKVLGQQVTLGGIQIQSARTAQQRQLLQLGHDKRMFPLDYQAMQQQITDNKAKMNITNANAFETLGYVPADKTQAEALATQLGYTTADGQPDVEKLMAVGKSRWELAQNRDKLAYRIQQQVKQLNNDRVRLDAVQHDTAVWNKLITQSNFYADKVSLGAKAFAAAANGDLSTLKEIEGIIGTDPEAAAMFGNIDFQKLHDVADKALGDQAAKREFEKSQRAALLRSYTLNASEQPDNIVQAAGKRFMYSDNTPGQNGAPSQLDKDINGWVQGFSNTQLQAMYPALVTVKPDGTIDATAARQHLSGQLSADVNYQRAVKDQSDASASLNVLAKAVPGSAAVGKPLTPAQQDWKDQFIKTAEIAGISGAPQIAEGLLLGQDHQFWLDSLRARQLELASKLNKKNLELLNNPKGAALPKDAFSALLSGLKAQADNQYRQLNSTYCSVPSGGIQQLTGGEKPAFNAKNAQECTQIFKDWEATNTRIARFTAAYSKGDMMILPPPVSPRDRVVGSLANGKSFTAGEYADAQAAMQQKYPDFTSLITTDPAKADKEVRRYLLDPGAYKESVTPTTTTTSVTPTVHPKPQVVPKGWIGPSVIQRAFKYPSNRKTGK